MDLLDPVVLLVVLVQVDLPVQVVLVDQPEQGVLVLVDLLGHPVPAVPLGWG